MERIFKPYDKEYMRMAMLKHEETFKEQVYELHRLYRIQKILMKRIENTRPKSNLVSRPARDCNIIESADNNNRMLEIVDESVVDLTLGLGLSSYNPRKKAENTPLNSDCGPSSFSSSSTGSSHVHRTRSSDESAGGCELRLVKKLHKNNNISVDQNDVEEEKLKQGPNWLFQVLSLNMT